MFWHNIKGHIYSVINIEDLSIFKVPNQNEPYVSMCVHTQRECIDLKFGTITDFYNLLASIAIY